MRRGMFLLLVFSSASLCAAAELEDRFRDDVLAQQGIYLPYRVENPTTPETRTLQPQEAETALGRDWLFQAEGKPLAERAAEEIGWTRQLAARLATNPKTPSLENELAELDALEKRLGELQGENA